MTLNIQEVNLKLADVQARFDEAQAKKTSAETDVSNQDAELYRLQGEFRVLSQMKDIIEQAEATAPADPGLVADPDAAGTIVAKPKKEKE